MKTIELIESLLEQDITYLDPRNVNKLVKACWEYDDEISCESISRLTRLISNNPNSRFYREEYHDKAMKDEVKVREAIWNQTFKNY